MYSAYKLNEQGDNIYPWSTPFRIWNQSVVPCPVLTVASWPAYRFLKRQIRWSGIPISFRIFHSLFWSTLMKKVKMSESHSVVFNSLWPPWSVDGILQARILEWVAVLFSRGSSKPRAQTHESCVAGGFFTSWATRETQWKKQVIGQYLSINPIKILQSLYFPIFSEFLQWVVNYFLSGKKDAFLCLMLLN